MYSITLAFLVFGVAVATAAPAPGWGSWKEEPAQHHAPDYVHTVHHYHVKKVPYPVRHIEKVQVPVPVHVRHVEKVFVRVPVPVRHVVKVPVPVYHIKKVHVPVHHVQKVHVPVHHVEKIHVPVHHVEKVHVPYEVQHQNYQQGPHHAEKWW